nr:hypothetical protein [Psychrobacter sp. PraFG1]UNK04957.1 hypothetical protein MN210_12805 [Psychrobacter sp. PraFG1]
MVVLIGVNDTTSNVSVSQWQAQLHQIIELGKRKFGAKYILFAYHRCKTCPLFQAP